MIGRFQVMALLQAARAKVLGYSLDEAQSFGLNRAIFYAAAKRGFRGATSAKHPGEIHTFKGTSGKGVARTVREDALGNEIAYYVVLLPYLTEGNTFAKIAGKYAFLEAAHGP